LNGIESIVDFFKDISEYRRIFPQLVEVELVRAISDH